MTTKPPALPEGDQSRGGPLPAKLEPLVETARAYARAATSKNTNRAYAADWRDYLRWRARKGLDLRPLADPECVGLYLAALASGAKGAGGRSRTVATIERRLTALIWNFAQRSLPFDRKETRRTPVFRGIASGLLATTSLKVEGMTTLASRSYLSAGNSHGNDDSHSCGSLWNPGFPHRRGYPRKGRTG